MPNTDASPAGYDISVVVPTYRRPRELDEALRSVLRQSGVRCQIIVVDDSPDAEGRAVVENLRHPCITYIPNAHPTGGHPAKVRNIGLREATAPLLHFLDDDDVVPEGVYARVIEEFAKTPDIGLLYGRISPFGDGPQDQLQEEIDYFSRSSRYSSLCRRLGMRQAFAGMLLFCHCLLVMSAGFFRREAVVALGGFDERIRLREDTDLFVRCIRRFGVRFIDDLTLRYRISSTQSLMHTANLGVQQLQMREREVDEGRRLTHDDYKKEWGAVEFNVLRVVFRSLSRAI